MNVGDQIEILVDHPGCTLLKKGDIRKIVAIHPYKYKTVFEVNTGEVLKEDGFANGHFRYHSLNQMSNQVPIRQVQYQVGQQIQVINNVTRLSLNNGDILIIDFVHRDYIECRNINPPSIWYTFDIPKDESCFNVINSPVSNNSPTIPGGIPIGNSLANNNNTWKFNVGDVIIDLGVGSVFDIIRIDRIGQVYELQNSRGASFCQIKDYVEKHFALDSSVRPNQLVKSPNTVHLTPRVGYQGTIPGWKFNVGDRIKDKHIGAVLDVVHIDQILLLYELKGATVRFTQPKDQTEMEFDFHSNAISLAVLNQPSNSAIQQAGQYSNQTFEIKLDDSRSPKCEHDWRNSRKDEFNKWCAKCGEYE